MKGVNCDSRLKGDIWFSVVTQKGKTQYPSLAITILTYCLLIAIHTTGQSRTCRAMNGNPHGLLSFRTQA